MNDDYLWNKSGEPDPQIQELENILAPLRYQPKPLEIPRKRNYFPPLAIAATVLIALLATGIWLRMRTEKSDQQPQQAKSVPSVSSVPSVFNETPTPNVSNNTNKPDRKRVRKPTFTKREREEALAAKQQLMVALRLASEKLKLAHKKSTGS